MNETIIFPHLHIALHHVGQSINIGGFEIAFYGIVIAIGMILGSLMILREAKRTGQDDDSYLDIILWTLIFSIIGARIYYVVFAWDLYKDDLLQIFNIRNGGLAIYGGILAGILTVFILTRIKKMRFMVVADTCILGLPIGQMLGRWGNFFNREAFGGYTDNLFAMQIPISRVRASSDITEEMLRHVTTIDGAEFISVHPTFLYESLWSLGVFLLLFFMRKHVKFHGQQFLTYMIAYGIGRFWIEGLRTDQLILFGTGIPVSKLLAAILVIGGAVLMVIAFRALKAGNLKTPFQVTTEEARAIRWGVPKDNDVADERKMPEEHDESEDLPLPTVEDIVKKKKKG